MVRSNLTAVADALNDLAELLQDHQYNIECLESAEAHLADVARQPSDARDRDEPEAFRDVLAEIEILHRNYAQVEQALDRLADLAPFRIQGF